MKKLIEIQKKLKAPKNQHNSFGNYNYRSCEDILEAVKPLLGEAILTINDDIVMLGERFYVKATATLKDDKEEISVSAYAREALEKKGMDTSQITGATSSYARKYALNGLFLIDDTKDADTMDNSLQVKNKPQETTEKIGFCSICGEQGIKAKRKNGTIFYTCPNWSEHRDKKEKFELKQSDSMTKEEIEFQKELDNIK